VTVTKCRLGCPTGDHNSYAECCKGLQINTGVLLTSGQQEWNRELNAYEKARSEGIQPDGTKMHKIEAAKKISDATGVAYGV
jgi:hypothetical protein